jgi:hypothetical protein
MQRERLSEHRGIARRDSVEHGRDDAAGHERQRDA